MLNNLIHSLLQIKFCNQLIETYKLVKTCLPLKFLITSFFVAPGLLFASGDTCLLSPLLGLEIAEKLALFCESVICDSSIFSRALLWFGGDMPSLNLRFFLVSSSSNFCSSCRLGLLVLERGIHASTGQLMAYICSKHPELRRSFHCFVFDIHKMAVLSCVFCFDKGDNSHYT